MNNFYLYFIRG